MLFAGPVDQDHSAPNSIVSDASVYGDARRALADRTLSFADFLQREKLVLRSDLLRPWANWVTGGRTDPALRHLLLCGCPT